MPHADPAVGPFVPLPVFLSYRCGKRVFYRLERPVANVVTVAPAEPVREEKFSFTVLFLTTAKGKKK